MKKKQFVQELREGDRIDDLFLVKTSRLAETRAGKPYLLLTIMDRTGEIGGPLWERAEEMQPHCRSGSFIRLQGTVQSYREQLQLKIDTLQPCPPEAVDPADFVPSSGKDREEMARELQRLARSVENPFLKKLLRRFFQGESLWPRFCEAPAAKGIHHAYLGGLLEHSLSVAQLADTIGDHYPGVDRSLLMAGALLHDVGKVEEMRMETAVIDYTSRGRLKGHLVIGSEMVAAEAARIKDFPQELLEQLQHLILSHHGRQEFGSPTVPMTIEAFLLSFLDDLDAKMNLMEQLRAKMTDSGMQWTEYQRSLERYLFLNPLPEEAPPEKQEDESSAAAGRQQTLF